MRICVVRSVFSIGWRCSSQAAPESSSSLLPRLGRRSRQIVSGVAESSPYGVSVVLPGMGVDPQCGRRTFVPHGPLRDVDGTPAVPSHVAYE